MKKLKSVLLLTFLSCFIIQLSAQTTYQDVVYLKNGSIIRGVIIEQIINVSVKIQTADNNVFVFKMEEIEKLTKEPIKQAEKPNTASIKEIQTDNGLHYYQGSTVISKAAVSIMMQQCSNTQANQLWQKGQSNLSSAKLLVGIGVPFTITGLAAGISYLATVEEYYDSYTNTYVTERETTPLIIMCATLPIGLAALIGGLSSLSSGKKKATEAIQLYNSSLKSSFYHSNIKVTMGLSSDLPGIAIKMTF